MAVIAAVVCFIFGVWVGFFLAALMQAAGRDKR